MTASATRLWPATTWCGCPLTRSSVICSVRCSMLQELCCLIGIRVAASMFIFLAIRPQSGRIGTPLLRLGTASRLCWPTSPELTRLSSSLHERCLPLLASTVRLHLLTCHTMTHVAGRCHADSILSLSPLSVCLSVCLSLCVSLCVCLSLSHSQTHTHPHTHSLSLSHTHTHTHSHTRTHTHTHSQLCLPVVS
jgi:hypothetical protein